LVGQEDKDLIHALGEAGEAGAKALGHGKGVGGELVGLEEVVVHSVGLVIHIDHLDVGTKTLAVNELLVELAVVARIRGVDHNIELLEFLHNLGIEGGGDGLFLGIQGVHKGIEVRGHACQVSATGLGIEEGHAVATLLDQHVADLRVVDVIDGHQVHKAVLLEHLHHGLTVRAVLGIQEHLDVQILDSLLDRLHGRRGRLVIDQRLAVTLPGRRHGHGTTGSAGSTGRSTTWSTTGSAGCASTGHRPVRGAASELKGGALVAITGSHIVITDSVVIVRERIISIIHMLLGKLDVVHGRNDGRDGRTDDIVHIVGIEARIRIIRVSNDIGGFGGNIRHVCSFSL